ncbi:hypothetical protein [Ensifer sp.]|uniref:hypothetical protein n=1 Tax=Ensifer sp. TaxID=1872086 RepID=UPI00289695B0|nr:hypothetical protein [Ensifer sp.]
MEMIVKSFCIGPLSSSWARNGNGDRQPQFRQSGMAREKQKLAAASPLRSMRPSRHSNRHLPHPSGDRTQSPDARTGHEADLDIAGTGRSGGLAASTAITMRSPKAPYKDDDIAGRKRQFAQSAAGGRVFPAASRPWHPAVGPQDASRAVIRDYFGCGTMRI